MANKQLDLSVQPLVAAFLADYEIGMGGNYASRIATIDLGGPTGTGVKLVDRSSATGMAKWEGERRSKDATYNTLAANYQLYEDGLNVDADAMRRDSIGALDADVREMGQKAGGVHWDNLCNTLIDAGATSTATLDGVALFGTHGFGDNDASNAQISGPTVSAAAPTVAEAATAIVGAWAYMLSWTDGNGDQINAGFRNATILTTHISYFAPFATAIATNNLASGLSNPVAGIGTSYGLNVDVVFAPGLTDFDGFYMFRTDTSKKALYLAEENMQFDYLGEGSDHYVRTNSHFFGVHSNRAAAYYRAQSCLKVTCSDT